MTRARGFTLPELMTVVAIVGLMAGLAVVSIGRSRREGDLDRFAGEVRDAMLAARRRAVATGSTYLVDIRANSVAYCQRDPANAAQIACPTDPAANCAAFGPPVACESVRPMTAGLDAAAVQWAGVVDTGQGVATSALGGGRSLAFLRNGTADSDVNTAVPDGFTLYLQGAIETTKHRKIVVFPASARPRLTDSW